MDELLALVIKLKDENSKAFRQLQKVIFDDLESDMCLRLEKHFHLYNVLDNGTTEFLVDDHFVTHPMKGEFYLFKEKTYEVISVTHYYFAKQPSTILLKACSDKLTK